MSDLPSPFVISPDVAPLSRAFDKQDTNGYSVVEQLRDNQLQDILTKIIDNVVINSAVIASLVSAIATAQPDITRLKQVVNTPLRADFSRGSNTAGLATGVLTAIPWDLTYLPAAGFSGDGTITLVSTSRITFSKGGDYLILSSLMFAGSAVGAYRANVLKLNGTTDLEQVNIPPGASTTDVSVPMATLINVNDNDYIEVCGQQDSGGGLAVRGVAAPTEYSWCSILKVSHAIP